MTAYMDHKDLANETIGSARACEIADNVHSVLDRIADAEAAAGREVGSVRMVMVRLTLLVRRGILHTTA